MGNRNNPNCLKRTFVYWIFPRNTSTIWWWDEWCRHIIFFRFFDDFIHVSFLLKEQILTDWKYNEPIFGCFWHLWRHHHPSARNRTFFFLVDFFFKGWSLQFFGWPITMVFRANRSRFRPMKRTHDVFSIGKARELKHSQEVLKNQLPSEAMEVSRNLSTNVATNCL